MIPARDAARLCQLADEVESDGGQVLAWCGDVRDEAHAHAYAQALVELAQSRFAGLDIAFNSAGQLAAIGATPTLALVVGFGGQGLRPLGVQGQGDRGRNVQALDCCTPF